MNAMEPINLVYGGILATVFHIPAGMFPVRFLVLGEANGVFDLSVHA
jgi:hypothetical protein